MGSQRELTWGWIQTSLVISLLHVARAGDVGPPKPYKFSYEVDAKDDKHELSYGHQEESDGHTTKGQYKVELPDGRTQIVTYEVHPHSGFQAEVTFEGEAQFPDNDKDGNGGGGKGGGGGGKGGGGGGGKGDGGGDGKGDGGGDGKGGKGGDGKGGKGGDGKGGKGGDGKGGKGGGGKKKGGNGDGKSKGKGKNKGDDEDDWYANFKGVMTPPHEGSEREREKEKETPGAVKVAVRFQNSREHQQAAHVCAHVQPWMAYMHMQIGLDGDGGQKTSWKDYIMAAMGSLHHSLAELATSNSHTQLLNMYKVVLFLSLAAVAAVAMPSDPYAPKYKPEPKPYQFAYGVADEHYGPNFGQEEKSDGKNVKGSYTVQLPDGRKQTVTYQADHYNGFHADVQYYGEAQYPPPSKYPPFVVKPQHYAPPPPKYEQPSYH
ncbi:Insect cuticle protein [Trinorchestia longiramus]|nr:Insect cuticle protein [Trinorchestia longiramus]